MRLSHNPHLAFVAAHSGTVGTTCALHCGVMTDGTWVFCFTFKFHVFETTVDQSFAYRRGNARDVSHIGQGALRVTLMPVGTEGIRDASTHRFVRVLRLGKAVDLAQMIAQRAFSIVRDRDHTPLGIVKGYALQ